MLAESDSELLPCPFCGSDVELLHTNHTSPNYTYWWVRCYCGIDADGQYNNRQGVINHWNRRANALDENLQQPTTAKGMQAQTTAPATV